MLSNEQKAVLKRAQREAMIDDEEYRDILENQLGFGFRSSKVERLLLMPAQKPLLKSQCSEISLLVGVVLFR